jgi:hypothetical protein
MKVSKLIEQLKQYESDDELIVAYWDKETVEWYSDVEITKDEWSCVVEMYEDREWYWQSMAASDFTEWAEKVIEERGAA